MVLYETLTQECAALILGYSHFLPPGEMSLLRLYSTQRTKTSSRGPRLSTPRTKTCSRGPRSSPHGRRPVRGDPGPHPTDEDLFAGTPALGYSRFSLREK